MNPLLSKAKKVQLLLAITNFFDSWKTTIWPDARTKSRRRLNFRVDAGWRTGSNAPREPQEALLQRDASRGNDRAGYVDQSICRIPHTAYRHRSFEARCWAVWACSQEHYVAVGEHVEYGDGRREGKNSLVLASPLVHTIFHHNWGGKTGKNKKKIKM